MFNIIIYEDNFKNVEYLRIIDGNNIYTCTNKKNAVVMNSEKAKEVQDRIIRILETMNVNKHVEVKESHYESLTR